MNSFTLRSTAHPGSEHGDQAQQRRQNRKSALMPSDAERISDPERGTQGRLSVNCISCVVVSKTGQHHDAESEIDKAETERRPPHRIVAAHEHTPPPPRRRQEDDEAQQRDRHRAYLHTPAKDEMAAIRPAIIAST